VPKTLDPGTAKPEDCIPCLLLPYSSARFLIFYLHSNAEDIGRCYAFCASLRAQFQVHVMAVEYPGYGICPGGPCDEQKVTETSNTAFRFVVEVLKWPLDSIIILGRSIGCGPAISLAARYQVSGVIVVSPMLSVKELCRDTIGPLAHLIEERFPNRQRVSSLRCPMLVVHGQKDAMIPHRHGMELYSACRSRKLLVCPQDMEHNTSLLANVAYFVLPVLQFFALPDYCFEEMEIPHWAYDKRLSTFFGRTIDIPANYPIPSDKGRQLDDGTYVDASIPPAGCFTCPAGKGAPTSTQPWLLPLSCSPWSACQAASFTAQDASGSALTTLTATARYPAPSARSRQQSAMKAPSAVRSDEGPQPLEKGFANRAQEHVEESVSDTGHDGVFSGHALRSARDTKHLGPKKLEGTLQQKAAHTTTPPARRSDKSDITPERAAQILSPGDFRDIVDDVSRSLVAESNV